MFHTARRSQEVLAVLALTFRESTTFSLKRRLRFVIRSATKFFEGGIFACIFIGR
jgi:hypothetical protein